MVVCFQKVLPGIPYVSNNLTWNEHVDAVTKKTTKRIYFMRLLKRAGVAPKELVHIYLASIRSIIEYAAPAWFFPSNGYLIDQLEAIKRRVLRIIFPRFK